MFQDAKECRWVLCCRVGDNLGNVYVCLLDNVSCRQVSCVCDCIMVCQGLPVATLSYTLVTQKQHNRDCHVMISHNHLLSHSFIITFRCHCSPTLPVIIPGSDWLLTDIPLHSAVYPRNLRRLHDNNYNRLILTDYLDQLMVYLEMLLESRI